MGLAAFDLAGLLFNIKGIDQLVRDKGKRMLY